jgi:peroxiredoxin
MRKILFLFALLFVVLGCHEKGKMTALLENIPEGTILNIFDLDSGKLLTRVPIHENKFEYSFNFPTPRKLEISEDNPKYPKYVKVIWVENTTIQITGNYNYFVNARITGSPSNDIYEEFRSFDQKVDNGLYELNHSKRISKDKKVQDSISNLISESRKQYKEQRMKLYLKYSNSYVALDNLKWETVVYNSLLDKIDIKVLYDSLPNELKLLPKGKLIKEYISLSNKPKIGDKYIDVTLSTPDGKTESLSNNLGKFTIIEFWASSCGPCRLEHPKLRNIYNKYHNLGLNIIGISADENLNDWKSAIRKDSIPWLNISDLRGANNRAFMIYEARAIPKLILINEKGIILDENIQIDFLKSKLEEGLKQNGL